MGKRIFLASPHMSAEGYELEYIHDAFNKNWIAPLGENVNEFETAVKAYTGAIDPSMRCWLSPSMYRPLSSILQMRWRMYCPLKR